MKAKVDAVLLKAAGRSIVALSRFPGADKKDKTSTNCLLSAQGDKFIVEAAGLGIYIKHTLPAEVTTEGVASIDADLLTKLRSTSFVDLQTKGKNNLLLKHGATRTKIEMPEDTEKQVAGGRPKKKGAEVNAIVPIEVLKESLSAVTFKPGLKEETLRLQIACTKKAFSMDGLDSYSFARMEVGTKSLFTCKKPFKLALRSNVLTNILREIDQEEGKVKIGVRLNKGNKPTAIKVSSKTFEIHYPTLGDGYIDLKKKITAALKTHKVDASFMSNKAALVEVVSDCCALHSSEETGGALKLRMDISKKKVVVSTDSTGAKTKTDLVPKKAKVRGTRSVWVHEGYLSSFLHLAPEGIPLWIESCGERFLRLKTKDLESGSIEYLVARVNAPSKQN